jgi:hypothetical protein
MEIHRDKTNKTSKSAAGNIAYHQQRLLSDFFLILNA